MRALRTRNKCSGRPPEAANDRLRAVTGADPLTPKQEVAEELPLTILRSFGTWSKLERWKGSVSGSRVSCLKTKKSSFWSVIFSHPTKQQRTISQLDWDVRQKADFTRQLAMTSSVTGLTSSKTLPKVKFPSKRGPGHCLVVCCRPDPLNFSESQRNHYIWEVCSANQCDAPGTPTPAAGTGQQKEPNSPHQYPTAGHTINTSKAERIGPQSFASSTVFTCSKLSPVRLLVIPRTVALQALLSMDSPGKNTGAGCHFLLRGIFLTQGLNPSLLHCRKTLNHLSHQGRPYSPDLSSTNFFKHLDNILQGKCFHNLKDAEKCFPRVCRILKHGFLHYRNKRFSLAKMCSL